MHQCYEAIAAARPDRQRRMMENVMKPGNTDENGKVPAVSVAGGFWTGSSAVVDLLSENSQCKVVPDEFSLFSFGQFFQDVFYPLHEGLPVESAFDWSLFRFLEFNRPERAYPLRPVARKVCTSVGFYPPLFFSRRAGMATRLGSEYASACERLYARLKRAGRAEAPVDVKELRAGMENVLSAAITGAPPRITQGVRVGVFDQLVAPPYIHLAAEALPGLRFVNVDRDWRDQYAELRDKIRRIVGVKRRLKIRPYGVDLEQVNGTSIRFFIHLRKTIDYWKSSHVGGPSGNVLWLRFEDVVFDRDRVADTLFEFLGLDVSTWTPGRRFDPARSERNIGKWRRSPYREEIEAMAEILGEPGSASGGSA